MNRQPLTNEIGEVRELTLKDFKHMRPASKVLPDELLSVLPKRGRPPISNPKKQLTIRLNSEIIDFFKSNGKGWQTEINKILQNHIDSHRTA